MVVTDKYSHESENNKLFNSSGLQMSDKLGRRNLLPLTIDVSKRNSSYKDNDEDNSYRNHNHFENGATIVKYISDENRNSIIGLEEEHPIDFSPTNICEVTSTEITERKTKKKTSAITSIRKLVKTTVVTLDSNTNSSSSLSGSKDGINSNKSNKENRVNRRKKNALTSRYRKKRNRRSRAIPNEGAPLWQPLPSCCWKSTSGRIIKLGDVVIPSLCEAEQNALKSVALQWLQEKCLDCQINIPKESNSVVARRRWKHILQLGKQRKQKTNENQEIKPQNPVFSIELYQVIENDKTVEKAHEIALAKLSNNSKTEQEKTSPDSVQQNKDDDFHFTERKRRLSDPLSAYVDIDVDISDYMLNALRTIDTLKEEEEEESGASRRKSRLIDALTLSSTSASSVCILDKDSEFKTLKPQVPKVILQTVDYITKHALNIVGVFRTGGSHKRVKQMKEDYDMGYTDVINEDSNPHDVAAIFKEFLRCLPDPLLTRELYPVFLAASRQKDQDCINEIIINLVRLLPAANRDTLQVALACLNKVAAHSMDVHDEDGNLVSGNKMDSRNLATLMAPNILHRCKAYKTPNAYQADGLNPEDNKAAIDIVHRMIELNDELFAIEANVHDKILNRLLDVDPETVDFVLRKKASRTSIIETISNEPDEQSGTVTPHRRSSLRRPCSAGPRTRFSFEEVSFHKSNSFNQGPYKPFIRLRKESTSGGSRPTSTKSDPPDRSSLRRSTTGLGTPPNYRRNFGQPDTNPDLGLKGDSPRDSGITMTVTPPFKRSSLRSSKDYSKISPGNTSPTNVIFRNQNRERIARDSAYESGIKEGLPTTTITSNRQSNANSVNLTNIDSFEEESVNKFTRHSSFTSRGSKIDFLNDVLSEPSIMAPPDHVRQRKISLPAIPTNYKNFAKQLTGERANEKLSKAATIDFEFNPEWRISMRDRKLSDKETTL